MSKTVDMPQPEQGLSDEQVRELLEGITPGEWEYYKGVSANEYHRGFQVTNHDLMIGYVHALSDTGRDDDGTGEANARLIAAAPQLARDLLATRAQLAASQAALSETEALINEWRMEAICTVSLATQRAYGAAAMQVDCALRLEKALAKAQAQGSGQGAEAEARDADLRADIESLANACWERAGDEQTPCSHAIMLVTFANELEQALTKAQAQDEGQGGE